MRWARTPTAWRPLPPKAASSTLFGATVTIRASAFIHLYSQNRNKNLQTTPAFLAFLQTPLLQTAMLVLRKTHGVVVSSAARSLFENFAPPDRVNRLVNFRSCELRPTVNRTVHACCSETPGYPPVYRGLHGTQFSPQLILALGFAKSLPEWHGEGGGQHPLGRVITSSVTLDAPRTPFIPFEIRPFFATGSNQSSRPALSSSADAESRAVI